MLAAGLKRLTLMASIYEGVFNDVDEQVEVVYSRYIVETS